MLAVLHDQVIVDFVAKTILKLDDISILEGVVNFFLIFIECLVVLPNDLENLRYRLLYEGLLVGLIGDMKNFSVKAGIDGDGIEVELLDGDGCTPMIFFETDRIMLFCSSLS